MDISFAIAHNPSKSEMCIHEVQIEERMSENDKDTSFI